MEENISSCEQTIEEIVVNEHAAAAEAANDVTDFNCDICDSKFKNLRGLRAHKGRLHKATGSPITQLDGEDDTDCDTSEKCLNCTFVSDFHREDVEYTLSLFSFSYQMIGAQWCYRANSTPANKNSLKYMKNTQKVVVYQHTT